MSDGSRGIVPPLQYYRRLRAEARAEREAQAERAAAPAAKHPATPTLESVPRSTSSPNPVVPSTTQVQDELEPPLPTVAQLQALKATIMNEHERTADVAHERQKDLKALCIELAGINKIILESIFAEEKIASGDDMRDDLPVSERDVEFHQLKVSNPGVGQGKTSQNPGLDGACVAGRVGTKRFGGADDVDQSLLPRICGEAQVEAGGPTTSMRSERQEKEADEIDGEVRPGSAPEVDFGVMMEKMKEEVMRACKEEILVFVEEEREKLQKGREGWIERATAEVVLKSQTILQLSNNATTDGSTDLHVKGLAASLDTAHPVNIPTSDSPAIVAEVQPASGMLASDLLASRTAGKILHEFTQGLNKAEVVFANILRAGEQVTASLTAAKEEMQVGFKEVYERGRAAQEAMIRAVEAARQSLREDAGQGVDVRAPALARFGMVKVALEGCILEAEERTREMELVITRGEEQMRLVDVKLDEYKAEMEGIVEHAKLEIYERRATAMDTIAVQSRIAGTPILNLGNAATGKSSATCDNATIRLERTGECVKQSQDDKPSTSSLTSAAEDLSSPSSPVLSSAMQGIQPGPIASPTIDQKPTAWRWPSMRWSKPAQTAQDQNQQSTSGWFQSSCDTSYSDPVVLSKPRLAGTPAPPPRTASSPLDLSTPIASNSFTSKTEVEYGDDDQCFSPRSAASTTLSEMELQLAALRAQCQD